MVYECGIFLNKSNWKKEGKYMVTRGNKRPSRKKNNSNIEDTPHLFGEGKKPVKKNKMRVRGNGKRNHFGKIRNRVKSIDQVEE